MNNTTPAATVRRALVAIVTSVLTGATAGALLARRPLVVRVDADGRTHVGELR
jgi:hypothetical protein